MTNAPDGPGSNGGRLPEDAAAPSGSERAFPRRRWAGVLARLTLVGLATLILSGWALTVHVRDQLGAERAVLRTQCAAAGAQVEALKETPFPRDVNAEQITVARRLGVPPVQDDAALAASGYEASGRLVRLVAGPHFHVAKMEHSTPLLVPEAAALVGRIGERMHARLSSAGLPPARFTVLSAFRTLDGQAALREKNDYATGRSAHTYGTTLDIAYATWRWTLVTPPWHRWANTVTTALSARAWRDLLGTRDRPAELFREAVGHSPANVKKAQDCVREALPVMLRAELTTMRDAGALLVMDEVGNNCFHLTVVDAAAEVVDTEPSDAGQR